MTVPKRFLDTREERSVFRLDIKFSIGLEYIKDSQTTVLVNGIGYCTDTNIVIPDSKKKRLFMLHNVENKNR